MDLRKTYLVLQPDNTADAVEVGPEFWADLSSGAPQTAGARLVAESQGRMLGAYRQEADWPHWERHPAGDEVLVLLSGRMTLIFDQEPDRRVELTPGEAAVVPRGVWHRALVHEPGTLLGITPGQGTEHRAI